MLVFLFYLLSNSNLYAQKASLANIDTVNSKFVVGGYIDVYYGYDFSQPKDKDRAYFVNSARHNELNINLAYISVEYTSSRMRAKFIPGFGTYMNANYAAEQGTLKNIVEGNIGIKLFKNKEIWLELGVLGSPYTNETAISKDQLMYSRSFAPEYVPYYLAGAKLGIPLSKKVHFSLYLLNGWQQIRDVNESKSIGTQLEYRPHNSLLISWSTYIGNENSVIRPDFGNRYFTDVYFIYKKGKFTGTSCFYVGSQETKHAAGKTEHQIWYNANLIGSYKFAPKFSLSGRLEYFNDPKSVQISPINPVNGFSSASASLCLNYSIEKNILARLESRSFFSDKTVFQNSESNPMKNSQLLIGNITVWF
ncbi:Putative beta-barrel porin-2, OmpL-like. bbp2 [Thermoflexibacter ruber]|uniref:Putative beta-barrel porin-2, OmpL-like. bbp2 n=2 Tax=Thermoflexibacter ruber TaxID=1003 RepID=A0A1I2FV65_9BACT|nr:Putative beta-barrel porin-2, OmpL-like. bbp2 [Thermoflexibacter ruber]